MDNSSKYPPSSATLGVCKAILNGWLVVNIPALAIMLTVLLGEVVQYEDRYRLCYLRGRGGITVALADTTRKK